MRVAGRKRGLVPFGRPSNRPSTGMARSSVEGPRGCSGEGGLAPGGGWRSARVRSVEGIGDALFFVLTWATLQHAFISCAGDAGRRGACIEEPCRRASCGRVGAGSERVRGAGRVLVGAGGRGTRWSGREWVDGAGTCLHRR